MNLQLSATYVFQLQAIKLNVGCLTLSFGSFVSLHQVKSLPKYNEKQSTYRTSDGDLRSVIIVKENQTYKPYKRLMFFGVSKRWVFLTNRNKGYTLKGV